MAMPSANSFEIARIMISFDLVFNFENWIETKRAKPKNPK